jgi:hypothetical protein
VKPILLPSPLMRLAQKNLVLLGSSPTILDALRREILLNPNKSLARAVRGERTKRAKGLRRAST